MMLSRNVIKNARGSDDAAKPTCDLECMCLILLSDESMQPGFERSGAGSTTN